MVDLLVQRQRGLERVLGEISKLLRRFRNRLTGGLLPQNRCCGELLQLVRAHLAVLGHFGKTCCCSALSANRARHGFCHLVELLDRSACLVPAQNQCHAVSINFFTALVISDPEDSNGCGNHRQRSHQAQHVRSHGLGCGTHATECADQLRTLLQKNGKRRLAPLQTDDNVLKLQRDLCHGSCCGSGRHAHSANGVLAFAQFGDVRGSLSGQTKLSSLQFQKVSTSFTNRVGLLPQAGNKAILGCELLLRFINIVQLDSPPARILTRLVQLLGLCSFAGKSILLGKVSLFRLGHRKLCFEKAQLIDHRTQARHINAAQAALDLKGPSQTAASFCCNTGLLSHPNQLRSDSSLRTRHLLSGVLSTVANGINPFGGLQARLLNDACHGGRIGLNLLKRGLGFVVSNNRHADFAIFIAHTKPQKCKKPANGEL